MAVSTLFIAACGGGGGGTSNTGAALATQSVGTSGGTVSVSDPSSPLANTSIAIPANALSAATTITIGQVTSGTGFPSDVLVATIGPNGTQFSSPATVTLNYSPAYLTDLGLPSTDIDTTHLKMVTMDPGMDTETLQTNSVNTANHTVTAYTTHLSNFAVVGYSNASLNGTYGAMTYSFQAATHQPNTPAVGTPQAAPLGFKTSIGTATFDGQGNFSFTATSDVDGTGGSNSGSGTYSVASDGSFVIAVSGGDALSGYVLAGGSVAVFSENPGSGAPPEIHVAIKTGAIG
ncbi:MAG: hypothetical protein ACREWJ_03505, partial [Rhodoferax sp.]